MAKHDVRPEVYDNRADSRYEAIVEGHRAVIEYELAEGAIIFTHTEVPEELEGHGIASQMAKHALEDARARGLRVVPRCPFVAAYIQRHPEYRDLVG